MNTKKPMLHV